MSEPVIRLATLEDAPEILAIYEPYILNTAITFEYDTIPLKSFRKRMEEVQKQFPWLVYEADGRIAGYAYCSRFKERAAFSWDCECSVYIEETMHKKGVASALYTKLFELVKEQGYYNVYALITNHHESSIALHKKFGFTEVGVYKDTGYKLGKWWDLLVMEKKLRNVDECPILPKSVQELS